MIKEKERDGWTQVFAILFKDLKKQGVPIEKAKVIELKPKKEARNEIFHRIKLRRRNV